MASLRRAGSRSRLVEVKALVEKPPQGTAPSNLMIPGRYILQPEVMQILEGQARGAGNEIQLTDAMSQMIRFAAVPCLCVRRASL